MARGGLFPRFVVEPTVARLQQPSVAGGAVASEQQQLECRFNILGAYSTPPGSAPVHQTGDVDGASRNP